MAQWVEAPAVKADDLSLALGHTRWEARVDSSKLPSDLHPHTGTHSHHTKKCKREKKKLEYLACGKTAPRSLEIVAKMPNWRHGALRSVQDGRLGSLPALV